jgi:acetyl-CoA acetyltransferase
MREAVVVASSRTGLAKSYRGSFNMTRPDDLAAHCIQDVLRKTPQLDPAEIEERFGRQLDLVIDGGVIVAEHSSMIDLTGDLPKVIRVGKGDVSLFQ